MTRLTRDQAIGQVLEGIQADLGACGVIRDLLERQFRAALRHRSTELTALAEQLMPQLDAMEQRRVQRVLLVRALHGQQAGMDALFASLPAAQREQSLAAWRQLEQLVADCQEATVRNRSLMAEQHSVMQRVLHGDDQTYAPA
jgi:flagella synthesis protein FlgN